MEGVRSPAQVFALVIGATLTVAGIVGFFYNASFGTGDETARDAVLGILDVNGWHNVVHIASGAIGLLVARLLRGLARLRARPGRVYLVVALLGFLAGDGDEIFNLIPVNTEDNFLHLLIGVAGSRRRAGDAGATAPPSTQRPARWRRGLVPLILCAVASRRRVRRAGSSSGSTATARRSRRARSTAAPSAQRLPTTCRHRPSAQLGRAARAWAVRASRLGASPP